MIKYHFKKGEGLFEVTLHETLLEDWIEIWGTGWYGLEKVIKKGNNRIRVINSKGVWAEITFDQPVTRVDVPDFGLGRVYF